MSATVEKFYLLKNNAALLTHHNKLDEAKTLSCADLKVLIRSLVLTDLEESAKAAFPQINEFDRSDDWGSDRQITAENAFFEECEFHLPEAFGEGSRFSEFALKATTEESINEALRIVRDAFASA